MVEQFYKKKILIALIAATAILCGIAIAYYLSGNTLPHVQTIDDQFLALLAKQEYNKAVSKVLRSLAFFTGCTTFVYALGLDMKKRNDKQAKGILRKNTKPHVQSEKLSYKNKISGRNVYQGSLIIKSFLEQR